MTITEMEALGFEYDGEAIAGYIFKGLNGNFISMSVTRVKAFNSYKDVISFILESQRLRYTREGELTKINEIKKSLNISL